MKKLFGSSPPAGSLTSLAQGENPTAPILVVTLSLDVGGAERHLSAVLPGLAARGWPVTIYCMNRLGAFAETVANGGVTVIGPPVERLPGAQATSRRLYATVAATARLFSIVRKVRPAIAHFFLPEAYIFGAPTALALRVPIHVMSRRGMNNYQRNWPGARTIEEHLHGRMDAILANSQRVLADLKDEGCQDSQLALIYNGVAPTGTSQVLARSEVRRELGIGRDTLLAVVVANLIDYKGHMDVLRALALAGPRLPADWSLVCIGRDEGALPGLVEEAHRLGLARNVRFLGVRHDVGDILRAADISILASHEEGFSNAVIEAMAAGLPSVVTDVGGNAEAVLDGEQGYVVPPRTPERLADAILRLAGDAELRHSMGEAARQRAEQVFTMEACIDRYEKVYRTLLAGRTMNEIDLT